MTNVETSPALSRLTSADSVQPVTHDENFSVEVDSFTPEAWSECLNEFADANIYQTAAYGSVRWGNANLSRLALQHAGKLVGLAQLRIIQPSPLRMGIAYLRWGPICHRKGEELDPQVMRAMADRLFSEYVIKRRLFLRVLPNAVQGTTRAAAFESAFGQFQRETFKPGESYRTFILDLEPPLEQLRKRLDQKWRNQLNRAEKNNLRVLEDTASFDGVIRLFDEMWKRKQFVQASDIREFKRMQEILPPGHKMRVVVCEQDGVPVSGMVGTGLGDSGIYLFGATSDQGMQSKGSYLLQWRMIQWLKESGIRYYNLNGINPETNPGVYHFKKGLSGEDVLYMPPLTACTSVLSKAFMTAGTIAKGGLRKKINKLLRTK
jgi:lipid II:glycine glycyltransferase (peptidoglycan interpeptide bridge formation enzyme)